jgi:GxxExxY protein
MNTDEHRFGGRNARDSCNRLARTRAGSHRRTQINVFFHGALIGTFIVDIVVDGKIIIEVKAVKELEPRDETQLLNYLKCAGGGTGLLVNFGRTLSYKRLVMGNPLTNLPHLVQIAESEGRGDEASA